MSVQLKFVTQVKYQFLNGSDARARARVCVCVGGGGKWGPQVCFCPILKAGSSIIHVSLTIAPLSSDTSVSLRCSIDAKRYRLLQNRDHHIQNVQTHLHLICTLTILLRTAEFTPCGYIYGPDHKPVTPSYCIPLLLRIAHFWDPIFIPFSIASYLCGSLSSFYFFLNLNVTTEVREHIQHMGTVRRAIRNTFV
jgi:hypothetical protein